MAQYEALKRVAQDLARSFCSTANYGATDYVLGHVLRAARATGATRLDVDLLSGTCGPPALAVTPVEEAARRYAGMLAELVDAHDSSMERVNGASVVVTFDLSQARPSRHAPQCTESPFACEVRLVDDRGGTWTGSVSDWWFPEPIEETRAGRRWLKGHFHPHLARLGIEVEGPDLQDDEDDEERPDA